MTGVRPDGEQSSRLGARTTRESAADVAVIGAGPYGLSVAAHLAAWRVSYALFGAPLERWRREFIADRALRSPVWASSFGAPRRRGESTIPDFRRHVGRTGAIDDQIMPEEFVRYGDWFAERHGLVTEGEARVITLRDQAPIILETATGATVKARAAIVATGLTHCAWVPQCASTLSPVLSTHSTRLTNLADYAGASVIVVGTGQSGVELVIALRQIGATVRWVGRRPPNFYDLPVHGTRSLVGAFAALSAGVALLPARARERLRKAAMRPCVASALRAPVACALTDARWGALAEACQSGDGVLIRLSDGSAICGDRVIWATGHRYSALRDPVTSTLLGAAATDGLPDVSRTGESVRPGVFFVGPWTEGRFGPAVRFLIGTHWQTRMVARAAAAYAREQDG